MTGPEQLQPTPAPAPHPAAPFVRQAYGRYQELRAKLDSTGLRGTDRAGLNGVLRSLEANLQSVAVELGVNLERPEA